MISLCQHCGRNEYGCDCASYGDSRWYPTIYYGQAEDTDLVQLRMNDHAVTLLIVALEELRHQRHLRGSKEGGILIGECDHLIVALEATKKQMAQFVPEGE